MQLNWKSPLNWKILASLPLILAILLTVSVTPARAQQPAAPAGQIGVPQLFATTCGWCHSDGGRAAGKGPQLMDTQRSDDFIRNRIKNGKEGALPAFDASLSDAQIDQSVKYMRAPKPHQG